MTGGAPAGWLVRRLTTGLLTLVGVQLTLAAMVALTPGDAATFSAAGAEHGLAAACVVAARADGAWAAVPWLGLRPGAAQWVEPCRPVLEVLGERVGLTARLLALGLLIGNAGGVAAGVAAAGWRAVDRALTAPIALVLATPTVVLGVAARALAAAIGQPVVGLPPGGWPDQLRWIAIPTLVLAVRVGAGVAVVTRDAVTEVATSPLLRHLAARGLPAGRRAVHLGWNAALPVLVVVAGSVPRLVAGSVLVEAMFGWPGVGSLLLKSATAQDLPTLQAIAGLTALVVVGTGIAVDLLTAVIDPRVRLAPEPPR